MRQRVERQLPLLTPGQSRHQALCVRSSLANAAGVSSAMTAVARLALRRAALCLPGRSTAAWLALVLFALALPGAAQQNCTALGCAYDCDATRGCYDACADAGWTLAAQAASGVYNPTCTARNVRPLRLARACQGREQLLTRSSPRRRSAWRTRRPAAATRACTCLRLCCLAWTPRRGRCIAATCCAPAVRQAAAPPWRRASRPSRAWTGRSLRTSRTARRSPQLLPYCPRPPSAPTAPSTMVPSTATSTRCSATVRQSLRSPCLLLFHAECVRSRALPKQAPSSGDTKPARQWPRRRASVTESVRRSACEPSAGLTVKPRFPLPGSDSTVYVAAYDGTIHAVCTRFSSSAVHTANRLIALVLHADQRHVRHAALHHRVPHLHHRSAVGGRRAGRLIPAVHASHHVFVGGTRPRRCAQLQRFERACVWRIDAPMLREQACCTLVAATRSCTQ